MSTAEDKETGRRLRTARDNAGMSVDDAALAVGISRHTVEAHEKGKRGVTRPVAGKYARIYGVDLEFILGLGRASRDEIKIPAEAAKGLPVVGVVAAGAFREGLESADMATERLPVQYDGAYAQARQFALLVQGPSMNMVYPEGTYVICVSTEDAEPRFGDHVVVCREKSGLFEYTLKELVRDPKTGRPALMPRSHDARFQTPVVLNDDGTDTNVKVIAVVIGSYQRRPRRGQAAFTD